MYTDVLRPLRQWHKIGANGTTIKRLVDGSMTEQLADKKCVPCRPGVPPLNARQISGFHEKVSQWVIVGEHHIQRTFRFPDFKQALRFVNQVGEIAEEDGHHPDMLLTWGKVDITIWTHAINGLTENDFILAAKIDRLMSKNND